MNEPMWLGGELDHLSDERLLNANQVGIATFSAGFGHSFVVRGFDEGPPSTLGVMIHENVRPLSSELLDCLERVNFNRARSHSWDVKLCICSYKQNRTVSEKTIRKA
jgi:hypothetical protein